MRDIYGDFKMSNSQLWTENYETMCHVVVDATKIPCISFISPVGIPCFAQAYEVVYTYGQTVFKAQLRWTEGVCSEFRPF